MKNKFFFGLVTASFSTSVLADQAVPEIVITAKNEQSIDQLISSAAVFDLDMIESSQVDDVPALIDVVAGISFRDSGGRGTQTGVFVRGVANSQIIVLIDGVRVGSATLGAAALNSYPIEAIERVEVIKGPFSGIYGADAVGGVIQLFTKKGGAGLGSARATFGSDSLQEYSLAFNGSGDNYSFHLSAQTEETDGIDRTSLLNDGNADIDGFEEDAFAFGGQLNISEATQASLNILASDSVVEFDSLFGPDPGLMTQTETLSTAFNISHEFSNQLRWSTTFGLNEDESATNGAFPSEFLTERDSLGSELEIDLNTAGSLTLGVDYYEENIESSNDFPVTDRDNTGAFAQYSFHADRFSLAASLRYDDNSAYGSDTNTSLAAAFDLTSSIRLSASYGTAFVAPSFNFLYFPFFGNPDLLPEESENIEVSLDGQTSGFSWRLSAYQIDIENLFSFDPNTFLAANIGSAEIDGFELSVSKDWADWQISFNADVLSATNQETGVELDDRAEQTLRLTASRNWGNYALRFDLKNERDRFDLSGTRLPSYTLFDVSGSYRFNDYLTVYANIDNLFDEDYTVNLINPNERFNTEGIQAKVSVRVNF